jgi:hypothetical protein
MLDKDMEADAAGELHLFTMLWVGGVWPMKETLVH